MKAARAATPREWAIAVAGGLALAALLVTLLRSGNAPAPPPAQVPATPPVASAPALPPVPAASGTAAPADLALTGLRIGPDGGMAIIRAGDRQFRLAPGRSLPDGRRLLRVEPGRAILATSGGELVLAFPDTALAAPASTPPGGDPTAWRLALSPVRGPGGAISGWRLDSLAGLAPLARAGLAVGDVLLAVDGSPLISEEKIIELPQELAANGQISLTYRRAGSERQARIAR